MLCNQLEYSVYSYHTSLYGIYTVSRDDVQCFEFTFVFPQSVSNSSGYILAS